MDTLRSWRHQILHPEADMQTSHKLCFYQSAYWHSPCWPVTEANKTGEYGLQLTLATGSVLVHARLQLITRLLLWIYSESDTPYCGRLICCDSALSPVALPVEGEACSKTHGA